MSAEIIAIVDDADRLVDAVPRAQMRALGLTYRVTYILVFNAAGQLLVQRRTADKDMYPGYLDLAAGGVVLADESYEQSAARELAEELGYAPHRRSKPSTLFSTIRRHPSWRPRTS